MHGHSARARSCVGVNDLTSARRGEEGGGFAHDVSPSRREHTTRITGLFLLLE